MTSSSNRQCATCQTCGAGTYSSGGCIDGTTNRQCSTCSTCSATQYETSACTSLSNRQCATCQTCGLETFSSGGCTGTANRECHTCTTCTSNEYETTACTSTSNRQCVAYPTCAGFGSSCGTTKHLKSSPDNITCASSTCEIAECCNPNPTCSYFHSQGNDDDFISVSRCDNGFHMKNDLAFICESNGKTSYSMSYVVCRMSYGNAAYTCNFFQVNLIPLIDNLTYLFWKTFFYLHIFFFFLNFSLLSIRML